MPGPQRTKTDETEQCARLSVACSLALPRPDLRPDWLLVWNKSARPCTRAGHALVPLLLQFGLSRRKFQLECLCDLGETFVRRPESSTGLKHGGSKEMRVDVADSSARKATARNENQHFLMTRLWDSWKIVPEFQQLIAIAQIATCQFADHHWTHAHPVLCQQLIESLVAMPQMIDPDRGIGKNQVASYPGLRLEIGFSSDSLAPRATRRRALSRSIRALRPSRSNADFSRTPVKATACSNNRSSMVTMGRPQTSGFKA